MPDNDSTRAPRYPFTRGNTPAEPSAARNPANDPLTELARLIGQHDPFSDPVPETARRDLRDILAGRRKDDWPSAPEAPAQQEPEDHYDDAPFINDDRHFPSVSAIDELPRAEQRYDDVAPYDPQTEYGQEPPQAPLYGDNGQLVPEDTYLTDDQLSPGNYAPEHRVAEETQPRGRKGLFAVVAVFGLAVVGTAGAYAYRTMFSGGIAGAPPLIRADSTPNKVAATSAGDASASKQIYDRLGSDRSQNEKVVSREEQPVDVRPAQPRSAFPPAPTTSSNNPSSGGWPVPPGTTSAPAPVPPGVAASANEPRRIRTIPIRSDQLANAPPAEAPAQTAAPAAPPAPVRQPTRQATTATAPAAPAAAANAPLSLNPQGAAAAPRAPKQTHTAAVAPEAAPSGAYVVQIAANKTQEEASAAFRSAQAKYPDVLGSRKLMIRKKEIAGKGTFYGAQVGPFASRDDATHLCEDLKSAGGTCIVQRN